MQATKQNSGKFDRANLSKLTAIALLLTACFSVRSLAQQNGQRTFSSPEEAAAAFVAAAQTNDQKAMLDILGPDGTEIISSGDTVEDAHNRANFLQKYQQMHRFVREPDGNTTLYTGAENWPSPIPLVSKNSRWYFDTAAGKKEILYRRVGRNEMSAIQTCKELVTAEKEYYASQHNEYAQKIFSDEGKHNGLYWKPADGEPLSPIGPQVAEARTEGYTTNSDSTHAPFRGYYYQVLTRQAKHAPGGAKNYVASGKMTGGFAFLAYPAEYRSSGVMTFIVSADGVVYEKDLGKKTTQLVKGMKAYNPDSTWHQVEEAPAGE